MIPTKLIIAGIVVTVLLSIVGGAYYHYTNLLETINVLKENNVKLDLAVKSQGAVIGVQTDALVEWRDAQQKLLERVDQLQKASEVATTETRRLNAIFARHDFTKNVKDNPTALKRLINRGTVRIFRMLECASGAEGDHCGGEDRPSGGEAKATKPTADETGKRKIRDPETGPPARG